MRNTSLKLLVALLICLTHGKTLAQENDKPDHSNRSFMFKVDPIHPFFRGFGGKFYFTLPESNISVFGGGGVILSKTNPSGPFAVVDGLLYFIPLNFIVANSADYFYELQGEMEPLTNGLYLEGGITIGSINKFTSRKAIPELFVRFVQGNSGKIYDLFYTGFGFVATSHTSLIEGGARFSFPLLRINPKNQYIAGLDCNFGGAAGTLIWERYYDTNIKVKDYIFVFDVILNFNLFIAF